MPALKSLGKIFGLYVLAYAVQVCFLIQDHVPFSLAHRLAQAKWWVFNPHTLMTMAEDDVMESYLSNVEVPKIEIPVIEGTWDEIKDEVRALRKDLPLVLVKNFSHGFLDQFAGMEAFVAATDSTPHSFTTVHLGANVGLGKTSEMVGLHDAVHRMAAGEQLYGGFIVDLLKKQPRLLAGVAATLKRLADIPSLTRYSDEVAEAVHHAFVYHGTWHWAMLHNAPVPDAFLQVANRKKWYFTLPDYIPHMRTVCLGIAGCRFMMDPRDQGRIPFREVISEPGDLLLFPPFWPHGVANLEEAFGWGVGVRPGASWEAFKTFFWPLRAPKSGYWATINWILRLVALWPKSWRAVATKTIAPNLTTTLELNQPHLEALSRSITEKLDLNHPARTGGHSSPYAGPKAVLTKTEQAILAGAGAKAEL